MFIYITAKDASQAHAIGRARVEVRLAACVNILDNMQSTGRWEGAICEDSETVLVVKTRRPLLAPLIKRV
ncbi:MAG: divalent-cation tolerance protein CutA [Chitinispirillaceae bacterium]|nr:divalent-cation tolerance protein CutA [Chitinispirillaceae bacterium]